MRKEESLAREVLLGLDGFLDLGFEEDMIEEFLYEYNHIKNSNDIWDFAEDFDSEKCLGENLDTLLFSNEKFKYWLTKTLKLVSLKTQSNIKTLSWRVFMEYKLSILHSVVEEKEKKIKLKKVNHHLKKISKLMDEDDDLCHEIALQGVFSRCLEETISDLEEKANK